MAMVTSQGIAAFVVTTILVALGCLHLYWALGGRWGMQAVLPTVEGRAVMAPGPIGTLVVAWLLLLSAFLLTGHALLRASPWAWLFFRGSSAVGAAFLLRAVGDFRFVGFFKRVRGTKFAEWDNKLFSPLCVVVAGLIWWALQTPPE